MPLEKERQFYLAHKDELLAKYKNMYVLIKDDQLIGAFPDGETAYATGISKFGAQPFLVRQVLEVEPSSISHLYSAVGRRADL